MRKKIFNLLTSICCCGAFDDLNPYEGFEPLNDEDDLSGLLTASSQAPTAMSESLDESSRDKVLKKSNILGFGSADVNLDYEFGETLGEGAFGVVRKCKNTTTGHWFACKTIGKRQLRSKADIEDIRREVQILMVCFCCRCHAQLIHLLHYLVLLQMLSSHPNVAGLSTLYEDEDAVHLILEFCEGGQIFDRIIEQGYITEQYVAQMFAQMVRVVDHCHSLGIAHRDIKPENFLLSPSIPGLRIKAADFGLSQFFSSKKRFRSVVGSAHYLAPEVLKRDYGPEADIWSLGVCLYIMLSGSPPFLGSSEEEIFGKILNMTPDFSKPPWPSISKSAKILLGRMLSKDPGKRPSTKELLHHRWLNAVATDTKIDAIAIHRLQHFAAATRVKHEALIAATQAMEAGATSRMLEIVMHATQMKGSALNNEDVLEILLEKSMSCGAAAIAALVRYSAAQIQNLSAQDCVAAALARSEARRDDFIRRLYDEFDRSSSHNMPFENFRMAIVAYGSSDIDDLNVPELPPQHLSAFNVWLRNNACAIQETAGFKVNSTPYP